MPYRLLLVGILFSAACAPPEAPAPEHPFTGDPWPEIRATRIVTLLPEAMDRNGLDAWLIVCRENNNDPMAVHVGCENAGGQAGFLFFRTADGLSPIAISPRGEATSLAELKQHDEVLVIERGTSIWDHTRQLFERFQPETIAINTGSSPVADGLSHTQYEALKNGIGSDWMARTISAEPLIIDWLSVKTPEEIEIMRRAAALTAQWEVEAYEAAVGGQTTDREIAEEDLILISSR